MADNSESRRRAYRVTYPFAERPTIVFGRHSYEVVDCSETGLRYEVSDRRLPALGSMVEGVVKFRRGTEVRVVGEVVRARGALVAIQLEPPLTFGDVMAEQHYLVERGYKLRD